MGCETAVEIVDRVMDMVDWGQVKKQLLMVLAYAWSVVQQENQKTSRHFNALYRANPGTGKCLSESSGQRF